MSSNPQTMNKHINRRETERARKAGGFDAVAAVAHRFFTLAPQKDILSQHSATSRKAERREFHCSCAESSVCTRGRELSSCSVVSCGYWVLRLS
jgi:hypothetical protein